MSDNPDILAGYFSDISEEEAAKRGEILNQTSSTNTRADILPGKYVMSVNNFAGKKKDTGKQYISPNISLTSKNSLMLNVALSVCDDGTPQCPKGTSILHGIVVNPTKNATEEKVANTYKFAKPQISSLIGLDKFEMTQEFMREYLTMDYDVTDSGVLTVNRDHKMKSKVYVTIDEEWNEYHSKIEMSVKEIRPAKEGDRSVTIAPKDESENKEVPTEATLESQMVDESPDATITPPTVDTSEIVGTEVNDEEVGEVQDF